MAHTSGNSSLPERELPAVGVTGEITSPGEVVLFNESASGAFFAKAHIFKRQ
jgi:hypothetical protein